MSVVKQDKLYIECGRSCLKDFLATDEIGSILWIAQFRKTIDDLVSESRELGGRCVPVYTLELIIATAINAIKNNGYVSKAKSQELELCSTAGEVIYMMNGDRYNNIPPYIPTTEEVEEAKEVIEYIKTISVETDYKYNLQKIAENDHCTGKFIGYAVSMVPFYRRAKELIIKKESKTPSNHVGTVDERTTLNLTLLRITGYDTAFGFMNIYNFEDEKGNVVVWKSTTGAEINQGDKFSVTAMIKAHDEYKGTKQTIITRPKFSK